MFGPHWDDNSFAAAQGRQHTLPDSLDWMYEDHERLGIIPRAIEQIFAQLQVMTEMARP